MATVCGKCPMDGAQMVPSDEVPGYCYCPVCEQMHRGIQTKDEVPIGPTGSEKSKQGSGVFSDKEIKQGYRKV